MKDMTIVDWIMVLLIFLAVTLASLCGFVQKWNVMIISIGVVFILMAVYIMIYYRSVRILSSYAIAGAGAIAIVMAIAMENNGSIPDALLIFLPLFLIMIGLLFLIRGFRIRKKQLRCVTEVVASVTNKADALITYTCGGKICTVTCEELKFDAELDNGDGIKIAVNPNNPSEFRVGKKDYGLYITAGILFIILTVIIMVSTVAVLYTLGEF